MLDDGFALTRQAIQRQLSAMPHDLYLVRLIHQSTHRPFPGKRVWTATQLLNAATVKFLRIRNREGCDIYFHPFAEDQNAGYILIDLDDPDPAVLRTMQANGHSPCALLQTSPGHLQAWIQITSSRLPPATATAAAKQLAHLYGGDRASADWRHLGRLAGFTNQKPTRRTPAGYPPWVKMVHACAGVAPQGQALLQSLLLTVPAPPAHPSLDTAPIPTSIIAAEQATAIYQSCLRRWGIAERFPQPDWSIVDLWVARHLLHQAIPAVHVQAILRLASPLFPRRHGDPQDYLNRTLARAAFPAAAPGRPLCATLPRHSPHHSVTLCR